MENEGWMILTGACEIEKGAYAGVGEVACLLGRFTVFLNRVTVGGTKVTDLT